MHRIKPMYQAESEPNGNRHRKQTNALYFKARPNRNKMKPATNANICTSNVVFCRFMYASEESKDVCQKVLPIK